MRPESEQCSSLRSEENCESYRTPRRARGRHYPGKKTWGRAHTNWLTSLKLEHREQRIAFEEMLLAVRQVRERIERLEHAMREAVADWSLAPVVEAVQALRGIDMVGVVAFLAARGDLSRFENPRQLMAYLGLTPSERSTGESVKRGGITKAGNEAGPVIMELLPKICGAAGRDRAATETLFSLQRSGLGLGPRKSSGCGRCCGKYRNGGVGVPECE